MRAVLVNFIRASPIVLHVTHATITSRWAHYGRCEAVILVLFFNAPGS
jgi:hypothetical protein